MIEKVAKTIGDIVLGIVVLIGAFWLLSYQEYVLTWILVGIFGQ